MMRGLFGDVGEKSLRFVRLCTDRGPKEALMRTIQFLRYHLTRLASQNPIYVPAVRLHRRIGHHLEPLAFTDADPFKLIYIDPEDVTLQQTYVCTDPRVVFDDRNRFHKWMNVGKVVDGDWDRATSQLGKRDRYQVIKERFAEGKRWEETTFILEVIADVERGNERWNSCSSRREVRERCRRLDELYESIQADGYHRRGPFGPFDWREEFDELTVNIDRNGNFIRNISGGHRLFMAKIAGIERIPARVLLRHRDWQRTRNQLRNRSHVAESVLDHPDLADISR